MGKFSTYTECKALAGAILVLWRMIWAMQPTGDTFKGQLMKVPAAAEKYEKFRRGDYA
jgi:hypothetical protein